MAQKVNIVLVDDIDGTEAAETVSFALDGKTYEIDLKEAHAQKLRDVLAPYVGHARRSGAVAGRRARTAASRSDATEIRDWAKDNGFDVSARGRIPAEVREAFAAAH